MNQRQLANVLVKILGLSFFVRGITELITGVMTFTQWAGMATTSHSYPNFWFYSAPLITGLAELGIGFFLILRSRWLVEKLFKDEEK